jgi:hypothetical protein
VNAFGDTPSYEIPGIILLFLPGLQGDRKKETAFDEIEKIFSLPRLDKMTNASDNRLLGSIFHFEVNFKEISRLDDHLVLRQGRNP